jgi:hypothetical protein
MKNYETNNLFTSDSEQPYPLPVFESNYGDYLNSTYLQKIEKIDWISGTIKYVESNPDAVILPETFEDIVQYSNEAFWTCSNRECNQQNMQIARQLNNLLGNLTEYSYRSGDLSVEQINTNNYNLAKSAAVRAIPDDINFAWGKHSVTFSEFFKNNPKSSSFYLTRKLFGGSYNYLPASLEHFCQDVSDSKIDKSTVDILADLGINFGSTKRVIYIC